MPDAFENILGQPRVRDFLRTSVKGGRVTHAYLFVGPSVPTRPWRRTLSLRPSCARKALTVRAEGSAARAMHAGASCARSTPTCTIMLRRA